MIANCRAAAVLIALGCVAQASGQQEPDPWDVDPSELEWGGAIPDVTQSPWNLEEFILAWRSNMAPGGVPEQSQPESGWTMKFEGPASDLQLTLCAEFCADAEGEGGKSLDIPVFTFQQPGGTIHLPAGVAAQDGSAIAINVSLLGGSDSEISLWPSQYDESPDASDYAAAEAETWATLYHEASHIHFRKEVCQDQVQKDCLEAADGLYAEAGIKPCEEKWAYQFAAEQMCKEANKPGISSEQALARKKSADAENKRCEENDMYCQQAVNFSIDQMEPPGCPPEGLNDPCGIGEGCPGDCQLQGM